MPDNRPLANNSQEKSMISWHILVLALLGGAILLIPLFSYLSSRRMVGKSVSGNLFDSADQLIYFYSANCGPCRAMTPIIDRLAENHDKVMKVDIAQDPNAAREYGIRATPTTILVKGHVIKEVMLGAKSQRTLEQLLAEITP
jgi:thioredoxin 1